MSDFESLAKAFGFIDFETEDGRYADDFLQHFYLGWHARSMGDGDAVEWPELSPQPPKENDQ